MKRSKNLPRERFLYKLWYKIISYEKDNNRNRRLLFVRKSTMAKDLAREIGYIYIDSGAMYRAVTLYSMENGIFTAEGIDTEKLKKQINSIRISFQLNPETGRPTPT